MKTYNIKEFISENYSFLNVKIIKTLETRGGRRALLFESKNNKYVHKAFEKNLSKTKLKKILLSQHKMNSINFSCPEIILSKKGNVFEYFDGHISCVYKYIEGSEAQPSPEFFCRFGQLVAGLHSLSSGDFKLSNYNPIQDLEIVTSFIKKQTKNLPKNKIIINSASLISVFPKNSKTIIHRDLSFYNIIVGKEKLYLLDYDNLSKGSFYIDLGHVVAYMIFLIPSDVLSLKIKKPEKEVHYYPEWLAAFLRGYLSERKAKINPNLLISATVFAAIKYIYQNKNPQIYTWNFKRLEKILLEQENLKRLIANVT